MVARRRTCLKTTKVTAIVFFPLFIPIIFSPNQPVTAVPLAPVGSCFPIGPTVVNQTLFLANLKCTHTGDLNVTSTGSLVLENSTLIQNGNGTTSIVTVNQFGRLALINSSLTFLGQVGVVKLLDNSSASLSKRSSLLNSNVTVANGSSLVLTQNSLLSPANLFSLGVARILVYSSTLANSGGVINLKGDKLLLNHAVLSLANSKTLSLSMVNTQVLGSYVRIYNSGVTNLGNYSSTLSTTLVDSSTISVTAPANATTNLYGTSSLTIWNSSIISDVPSSGLAPLSNLGLLGGKIAISRSYVLSTSREYYGYTPNSKSVLNISSLSDLDVSDSQLISGQTAQLGTYRFANLQLSSLANTTVYRSLLRTVAFAPTISLTALPIGRNGRLTLNQTMVETQNATGLVSLRASYAIVLAKSKVDALFSTLRPATFLFNSIDSTILVKNVTLALLFGTSVQVGTMYNTTVGACFSTPCLRTTNLGAYRQYGWLLAKVASSSTTQFIENATVTATDTRLGLTQYSSRTNATGWAKIPVLLLQYNGTKSVSRPFYAVQASHGGLLSAQQLLASNNTFTGSFTLAAPVDLTGLNLATETATTISQKYNVLSNKYYVAPAGLYGVGQYLGAQYIPYVTIVSNAAVLSFKNNASNSELDFGTVGLAGNTFYFVVIYPRNFSLNPISIRVDRVAYGPVVVQSNSTHYFSTFSVPSGIHSIAVTYLPPNAVYSNPIQYPRFFPPLSTIFAVVSIGAVGIGFLVIYLRKRERGSVATNKT